MQIAEELGSTTEGLKMDQAKTMLFFSWIGYHDPVSNSIP